LELWRILEIKVTPKAHGVEYHACNQLKWLMRLADFCEDWVERLHQLGLKINWRTRTISNKDQKYQLYTKWEQISGNHQVQSIKRRMYSKQKRELTTTRGSDTAYRYKIQSEKKYHCKEALGVDTSQWMGENALLGPCIILRQDAAERCNLVEQ
jgi:nucleotidyltransferase/DNA polymerase involved in DNA repair